MSGSTCTRRSIEWLQTNVAPIVPTAEFRLSRMRNARYNRGGKGSPELELGEVFDCITLVSVFSHMKLDQVSAYLPAMRPLLAEDGCVYLTIFVEDGVEPDTENPKDYLCRWFGPLHCVRINRHMFEAAVADAGLQVYEFRYRAANGQSVYVLRAKDRPFTPASDELLAPSDGRQK